MTLFERSISSAPTKTLEDIYGEDCDCIDYTFDEDTMTLVDFYNTNTDLEFIIDSTDLEWCSFHANNGYDLEAYTSLCHILHEPDPAYNFNIQRYITLENYNDYIIHSFPYYASIIVNHNDLSFNYIMNRVGDQVFYIEYDKESIW